MEESAGKNLLTVPRFYQYFNTRTSAITEYVDK
jgi:hypothetical protein